MKAEVYWFDCEGNFVKKVEVKLQEEAKKECYTYGMVLDFDRLVDEFSKLEDNRQNLETMSMVFLIPLTSQYKLVYARDILG